MPPLVTEPAAPAPPEPPSILKGALVGAAAGLLVVTGFVAGARLVLPIKSGTALPPAAATAVVVPDVPALDTPIAQPAAAPGAPADPAVPVVAASALPLARPLHRTRVRTVRHAAPVAAAVSPSAPAGADEPAPSAAPLPAAASAAPASSPGTGGEPAPDDSASSLVPVIPEVPPPQVDSFVKAVQTDIQEAQSHQGRH